MRHPEFSRLGEIVERMSDEELAAKLLKLTRVADNPRHRDYVSYHLIKDEYDKRKWIRAWGEEYVPRSDRQKKLEEQIETMHWLLFWHDNATRDGAVLPKERFIRINGLEYLGLITFEGLNEVPEDVRDGYVHDGAETNRIRILNDIERLRNELRYVISTDCQKREARMQLPQSKTPAYKKKSRRRFTPRDIERFVPLWIKGVQDILDSHPKMTVEGAIKKYASTTLEIFREPFSWGTIRNRIYESGYAFRRRRRGELSETIYRGKVPP